jgi:hypothetical protein
MKKILGLLDLVATTALAYTGSQQIDSADIQPKASSSRNYVLNQSALINTAGSSSSGATLVRDTTTANIDGIASWGCDGAAQNNYCEWTVGTVYAPDTSGNCQFSGSYFGDARLYDFQVLDGSANVLASTAVGSGSGLSNVTAYTPFTINYPCGASGARKVRLTQTQSGNGALVNVGRLYYGAATNIGSVAQAQMVGVSYFANTASCTWSRTNTALGAFGTTSDCPGPTIEQSYIGSWQTTDADLPRQTINNLPPGIYEVTVTGIGNVTGGTGTTAFAVSDGTSTRGQNIGAAASADVGGTIAVTAVFSYADAGTRTFELFGAASANTVQTLSNTASLPRLQFAIKRFPSASEIYVRPDQTGITPWVAYTPTFGAGFGTVTSPSFFSRRVGDSLEIVGKWTNGTVASSAATITVGFGGANANVTIDTSKVPPAGILGTAQTSLASTTYFNVFPIAPAADGTSFAFSVQNSTNAYGAGPRNGDVFSASSSTNSVHLMVPIVGWSYTQPAPLLVGSVTSNSSGLERIERATITPTDGSTCTITSQSGSWISSTTPTAAGDCTLNVVSGLWSSSPACTLTVTVNDPATIGVAKFLTKSTTAMRFQTVYQNGSTTTQTFLGPTDIICMGPR